ncbi:TPA: hypothetical protein R4193_002817 [Serratia marcescens]|uniref:hypothetical protein n=1 Tax=Serratia marcescens TaxID=615 RepID=UPI001C42A933|nr:hypothetical protein [Serratia marcescens]EGT0502861.1 hypothetical protein [Serratia marcescens]MDP8630501.1 hypothetical protein [Serratia marcescens]MDP8749333.1 hypothetical protein [Serratia marcescens]MDP8763640.1 hypothetical protein [Serratia marcescens]HBH7056195.1 hypothetical protein [Serratia marcescens]
MNKERFIAIMASYPLTVKFQLDICETRRACVDVIYLRLSQVGGGKSHCVHLPMNQATPDKEHLRAMCRQRIPRLQKLIDAAGRSDEAILRRYKKRCA